MARVKKPTEAEILNYMKNLDLSHEEAIQLWKEDNGIEENAEQIALDKKASAVKINHDCGNRTKGQSKPHIVQASNEKMDIFNILLTTLSATYGENISVEKPNKEIAVVLNGKRFKVDLVEHRPPKNKET